MVQPDVRGHPKAAEDLRPPGAGRPVHVREGSVLADGEQNIKQTKTQGGAAAARPGQGRGQGGEQRLGRPGCQ